jgi:hypothetical protein
MNLADYTHPHVTGEWHYGPDRGVWTGGHPITATAEPVDGVTVSISGPLGVARDDIPELVAWLTAVHEASAPTESESGAA